jgi:hypothetical protein
MKFQDSEKCILKMKFQDSEKCILKNEIIYTIDDDNNNDNNNVYVSYKTKHEERFMMIIPNATNIEDAEIFRLTQNELEDVKNKLYEKMLNPNDLDIC